MGYICRAKNWVEINDDPRGRYNTNSQIKFKTTMLNSSLYNQSDTYILVEGSILIESVPPPGVNPSNNDKKVVFKNCAPFPDCIS